jgi:hypothetical protein
MGCTKLNKTNQFKLPLNPSPDRLNSRHLNKRMHPYKKSYISFKSLASKLRNKNILMKGKTDISTGHLFPL